jgi:hypothetical protein
LLGERIVASANTTGSIRVSSSCARDGESSRARPGRDFGEGQPSARRAIKKLIGNSKIIGYCLNLRGIFSGISTY